MSSSDGGPRLSRALTYIETSRSYGGFGESFVAGAGGLVIGMFTMVIGIGEAFASLIIQPTDAFASVTALLIEAGFGGPATFFQSAWNAAAVGMGMSPWLDLGPFVIIAASLAVIGGLAPMLWYLDVIDADTLTGINLPVVELDTGGDLDDED